MSELIRIAPTFLDSVRWYQEAEDEWKDDARRDLLDRLRGIQTTSEAKQRGADFEATLCRYCDGLDVMKSLPTSIDDELKNDEARERFKDVLEYMAERVNGALRQVYVKYRLMSTVEIHGYVDFWLGPTAYDTKTTAHYAEDDLAKYRKGYQHRAYLAALHDTGVKNFEYLITDFKGAYSEYYAWDPHYIDELKGAVNDWLSYLKIDDEMREAWEARQAVTRTVKKSA